MTQGTAVDRVRRTGDVLDLLGMGFGPSNLAIAVAQLEMAPEMSALFLERRPAFGWHDGMLFATATMQVNFMKDLASLRDPRSRFTFPNFLHEHGRLASFTNMKTMFPRRVEFHQYLEWCARHFDDRVAYDTWATEIAKETRDGEDLFRVTIHGPDGTAVVHARSIVYSCGLEPHIPFPVSAADRVLHAHTILRDADSHPPGGHYAVVGAGQSAAEIVKFLFQRGAKVTAVVSRFGYMPTDDSPFVNEVFDPDQVDTFFNAPSETRSHILSLHASTNYSGVDLDLLSELYKDWYHDRVAGTARLDFLRMSRVTGVEDRPDGARLRFQDAMTGIERQLDADYVICATGFRARSPLGIMTEDLREQVALDDTGEPVFARDYSLRMRGEEDLAIFAPHMTTRQHGLSATLISNMAVRSGEILDSIEARIRRMKARRMHLEPADD